MSLSTEQETAMDPLIEYYLEQMKRDDIYVGDYLDYLATSSRSSDNVRRRLAEHDTLVRLVELARSKTGKSRSDVTLCTALRCIGNACYNNEQAANTVVSLSLDWLVTVIRRCDNDVVWIAGGVLNNICNSSVEAQKQACRDCMDNELLFYTVKHEGRADAFGKKRSTIPLDLILLIASHRKEVGREGYIPSWAGHRKDFTTEVLRWATAFGPLILDDWAYLLEISLTYLREPEMQAEIIKNKQVDLVWKLLNANETRIAGPQQQEDDNEEDESDPEEIRRILKPESMSLVWVLSDLAAAPSFATNYSTNDPWIIGTVVDTLLHAKTTVNGATATLNSESRPNAACQILGNLLHGLPVSAALPLVYDRHLHRKLLAAMASTADADFLHSASGLLMKLALPSVEVCEGIASDANMLPALQKLNTHPIQQLKQDALALIRILGKNSPAVQERLREVARDTLVAAAAAENQEAATGAAPEITATESVRITEE